RNEAFARIRAKGGPSGFLSRKESEYDVFGAGHAATSISAALGIATARDLQQEDYKVVAIIGDGSMTSGIAYEALNNAGHTDRDLIVVLNDNEMSISPNVGAIHKYLTGIITNPFYNRIREEIKQFLQRSEGGLTGRLEQLVLKMEEGAKGFFTAGMLFEELGFRYVGPIDGHDLDTLVDTFREVRKWTGPRLVHVITKKGKGFPLGEQNPVVWHGATPFDKISGEITKKKSATPADTSAFGKGLVELGEQRDDVVVITAAMPSGTGTGAFGERVPERYFDVGIAEGHGVTFAAGMAPDGVRPVAAVYPPLLRRRHRGGPWRLLRGLHGDGGCASARRDLLPVAAAGVPLDQSRRRHPEAARRVRDGLRRSRAERRPDAHGPLRHRVHARGAEHGDHRTEGRRGDARVAASGRRAGPAVLAALPARQRPGPRALARGDSARR